MIDEEMHRQLYLHKDHLLERLQKALKEVGLEDFDIDSIGLYARKLRSATVLPVPRQYGSR